MQQALTKWNSFALLTNAVAAKMRNFWQF